MTTFVAVKIKTDISLQIIKIILLVKVNWQNLVYCCNIYTLPHLWNKITELSQEAERNIIKERYFILHNSNIMIDLELLKISKYI